MFKASLYNNFLTGRTKKCQNLFKGTNYDVYSTKSMIYAQVDNAADVTRTTGVLYFGTPVGKSAPTHMYGPRNPC